MKKPMLIPVVLFAAMLCLVTNVAPAREPSAPLSAYGRLPYLEDVALSPSGARLAFVKTTDNSRNLLILDTSGKTLGGAVVGNAKLRSVSWQDDDNVLLVVSMTGGPPEGFFRDTIEWYMLEKYTISKNSLRQLSFKQGNERTLNVLAGNPVVREVEGQSVLYAPGYWIGGGVLPAIFSFMGDNDVTRMVARGTKSSTTWLIDQSGRVAAQFEYENIPKTWEIRARRNEQMISVASGSAPLDPPSLLGFDVTGQQAIVEMIQDGDPVWRPISLVDGVLGEPLERGASLHGMITDPRNGRLVGGVSNTDDRHYVFFDNELQATWNAVLRAFPNDVVHWVSHSADFSKLIVEVFGRDDGFQYAYFDWYAHRSMLLGPRYKNVTRTAEVRRITYPAGDGLAISGFLTVPRDLPEKNLPLVVFPHGGPAAQDTERFDWWAQALADQGYVVLQPNYRGSNVTFKLMEAGYGQWGRKMQTDLSDGVQYLVKQGLVDPSRVCIVGASYGGYAALAGVTLQSGIYRCAVSVAGVSNLSRLRTHTGGMTDRYWDRFWGVSEHDNATLRMLSPIDHVQEVTVPILLIHGHDDTVVPFEQSDDMFKALKHAGKAVDMVTLNHEDHWLSSSDTRLQMLETTVAFLRAHNPPD